MRIHVHAFPDDNLVHDVTFLAFPAFITYRGNFLVHFFSFEGGTRFELVGPKSYSFQGCCIKATLPTARALVISVNAGNSGISVTGRRSKRGSCCAPSSSSNVPPGKDSHRRTCTFSFPFPFAFRGERDTRNPVPLGTPTRFRGGACSLAGSLSRGHHVSDIQRKTTDSNRNPKAQLASNECPCPDGFIFRALFLLPQLLYLADLMSMPTRTSLRRMPLALMGTPGHPACTRSSDGNTRTLVEISIVAQPAYHPLAGQLFPGDNNKQDHQYYEYSESHFFFPS